MTDDSQNTPRPRRSPVDQANQPKLVSETSAKLDSYLASIEKAHAITAQVRRDDFRRSAVPDDELIILIKSQCVFCGHEIIDSVGNGIVEKEREHIENCTKKAA
jgi:hypothetical protein